MPESVFSYFRDVGEGEHKAIYMLGGCPECDGESEDMNESLEMAYTFLAKRPRTLE